MNDVPTVVSGIGRCGTSMAMKMLVAGGLKLTGTDSGPPLLEDGRTVELPSNSEWLRELNGEHAVKILDVSKFTPPSWFKCRAIWMRRNWLEQAKSVVKYYGARHGKTQPVNKKKAKADVKKRTAKCLRILNRLSGGKCITLEFENVLADPLHAARQIAELLERDMNLHKMASVIVKRPPECLPVLAEFPPGFRPPLR